MERIRILKKYEPKRENLLLLLHALQRNNPQNDLTEEDLTSTAQYLSLPLSEINGVATFYSMYALKPRGQYLVRICQSPPCHLAGSTNLIEEISTFLGVKVGETTPDGLFTLETTECLGVCGVAPVMMVNEEVHGNLTTERVRAILAEKRRVK
jgi:NADH-quinone oxidoreductase subunit E